MSDGVYESWQSSPSQGWGPKDDPHSKGVDPSTERGVIDASNAVPPVGFDPSAQPRSKTETRDRITIIQKFILQSPGQDAFEVGGGVDRMLESKEEQPYHRRNVKVGYGPKLIDVGWFESASSAGLVVVENCGEVDMLILAGSCVFSVVSKDEIQPFNPPGSLTLRYEIMTREIGVEGRYNVTVFPR